MVGEGPEVDSLLIRTLQLRVYVCVCGVCSVSACAALVRIEW